MNFQKKKTGDSILCTSVPSSSKKRYTKRKVSTTPLKIVTNLKIPLKKNRDNGLKISTLYGKFNITKVLKSSDLEIDRAYEHNEGLTYGGAK